MAGKNQYTAKQFVDAIPGTGGIVTLIAKRVGCAWDTAKKYIDTYPTITQAYENECESILDLAEMKVIESLKAGDGPMLRYYLSTKGKRRGYVERQEHTGADGGVIEIELSWEDARIGEGEN